VLVGSPLIDAHKVIKTMSKNIKYADAIRALAMDAVQKANSGHPGMPMGMADIATVLWQKHLSSLCCVFRHSHLVTLFSEDLRK
jgi:transketolase N-terminal domain/subunit